MSIAFSVQTCNINSLHHLYCILSVQEPGSGCTSEEEEEDEEEEEEEEVCSTERTGADQRYDEHMDEAAEQEGLQRYREARANEMFPDEVDTPLDVAARIRSALLLLCGYCEFRGK